MRWLAYLYNLLSFIIQIEASISDNFYKFMVIKHGKEFADSVARHDFGNMGSFGGGKTHKPGTKTRRYELLTTNWLLNGYTFDELYGTSYGSPILPLGLGGLGSFQWGLKCEYIKTIRHLIIGVSEYTNSSVNVLSYSMGGAISRKAILGGKCVDSGEDLGSPITHLVENYLGVAGAMKGAVLCAAGLKIGICSNLNGMSCNSAFMKDINSKTRYEASNKIYVIQSITDEIVGYIGCNGHPAQIDGADKTVTLFGLLHLGVIGLTGRLQYNLIRHSKVVIPRNQRFLVS